MTTKRTGKGIFDTNMMMYTQSETVKTSNIVVPDDATGPGKQIRMVTTLRTETKVTPRK
jgi:hypothetical protein